MVGEVQRDQHWVQLQTTPGSVLFNFVLHHAGKNTIPLLLEAKRVSKYWIIVVEDLQGETKEEAAAQLRHDWQGIFRPEQEWISIFKLMHLPLVDSFYPSRDCVPNYKVPRAGYVLGASVNR